MDLTSASAFVLAKLQSSSLKARNDVHLLRKAWHMGTGVTGLAIYHILDFDSESTGLFFVLFALFGLAVEFVRLRYSAMNTRILKVLGPFMRDSEKDSVSGLPFYALGVGLSLLLFEERVAVLSILFLVFADPIASLFGILFGKDKILPNKSLQGFVAGFCVCYLLALTYSLYYAGAEFNVLIFALIAGLVGALSELLSAWGVDDNLTIPLFSGFGLTLLNFGFNFF
jgi:diacylglycerol kinase (CTP)